MPPNYVLILCAGAIRYPSRAKPGDRPRALLQLNGETLIERLLRQTRSVSYTPVVAVGTLGRGGWEQWHIDKFAELGCKLVVSRRMKPSYFMGTTKVLLEAVQDLGVKTKSRLVLVPGDFVFTDKMFRGVCLKYPAPCVYCLNDTDPGTIVSGKALLGYLELGCKYEAFAWRKQWFEFAGLWIKERARLKALGFRFIGQLRGQHPKHDVTRFVEVDGTADFELAKRLVALEKQG